MLHPDVCGGSHEGLLAVHSLSKRSNLAGYRAGFVAGDPALVAELLAVRKHLGLMVPGAGAGRDGRGARRRRRTCAEQRARYARAGATLLRRRSAAAGFRIDHSEAGLYLWATRGRAVLGHRAAGWPSAASWSRPATSTAPAGARHVRVALTATDERVAAAAARLP